MNYDDKILFSIDLDNYRQKMPWVGGTVRKGGPITATGEVFQNPYGLRGSDTKNWIS
jgi:hypothetical protein